MRSLLALCVMLGALLWSPQCGAQASLKLAPEAGEAPARLVLNRGVYEATFVLSNSGDAAASVRVDVPRGEPSQPRVPPSFEACFVPAVPAGHPDLETALSPEV